jgi:hypothetical protein
MIKEVPVKEIVTVSEMSRMVRLSRARFYQLINEGIFPTPSRNDQTKRPFFSREQQEQCLEIRRSNRGANGKAVMFYGCRPQPDPKIRSKRKQLPISKSSKTQIRRDPVISELRHGLAQLGMTNVKEQSIREALARAYPDGHREVYSAELLRSVFGTIQCWDSADKLSG